MVGFRADGFAAQQFRVVVTGEVGACQVAVGHLSGQTLRQGDADRLRYVGHEDPQITAFHQDDLAAFGSRFGDHDHRIAVAF